MKWLSNRFLLLTYFALLTVLATVGCTSKEDPSEVLPLCGNHTCGELRMVTIDTSSDGFHYLNPSLSPDHTRVLFTADWKAIPAIAHFDEDNFYTKHRQLIYIPVDLNSVPPVDPVGSLSAQGAQLIRINGFTTSLIISNTSIDLTDAVNDRKGGPIWVPKVPNDSAANDSIIFWMKTPRGNRLFITDLPDCVGEDCNSPAKVLYMEPSDATTSGMQWQHMEPTLSPNGEWLAFTRSGCALPDSFETCSGLSLQVMRRSTAGIGFGYGAEVFPLTTEVSRLEKPCWSPDGSKIVFSAGLDMDGGSAGFGTEIFSIDVDSLALESGSVVLNDNLTRLTFTNYGPGDPISGVFNTSPGYTNNMSEIYFVSTRRAPSITLHDRNLWKIPADGSLDPEILYFSRADDMDPQVQADGSILFSSLLGFPTEILNRLEQDAYNDIVENNIADSTGLTEVEMRALAAAERRKLEYFEGVMAQLYIFTP